ncbi:DDE-type integrase/transposase/recombinase [Microvirga sp. BT689]|nr:DDE-type integrase/transposase/recombinase [Microvirga arvi]
MHERSRLRRIRRKWRHGRPERIVIDGSQTNREAILSCDTADRLQDRSRRTLKPIRVRQSRYLNNRIEQDHRAIKRRVRPMLGFKAMDSARAVLSGIEMVHMMRRDRRNTPAIHISRSRSSSNSSPHDAVRRSFPSLNFS